MLVVLTPPQSPPLNIFKGREKAYFLEKWQKEALESRKLDKIGTEMKTEF